MISEGFSFPAWLGSIPAAFWDSLSGLNAPGSRIYAPYILAAIVLGAIAYFVNRKAMGEHAKGGVLKYLFNPKVFFNRSSLVDVKLIIAGRFLTPLIAVSGQVAIAFSAHFVASAILGKAAPIENVAPGVAMLIMMTIAVTLASDFTTYWVHRAHHESDVLWPFHKVHHSAQELTPLTLLRKHPVYDLTRASANVFVVGPVQGILFALFGVSSIATILGANAIYALFNWGGSNLRHSHIWLSYGPFWSRIFISPSQHQIHHSCAVSHHDKNYGEIFAFWDWLFGTLYIPKSYEKIEFGVADAQGVALPQAHPTLVAALSVPFKECLEAMRAREGKRASQDVADSAGSHTGTSG